MNNIRDRRLLFPNELTSAGGFYAPIHKQRRKLLKWISTNTSGRFYLGSIYGGFVIFEDEVDVIMYKLGPHYDFDRVKKAELVNKYGIR